MKHLLPPPHSLIYGFLLAVMGLSSCLTTETTDSKTNTSSTSTTQPTAPANVSMHVDNTYKERGWPEFTLIVKNEETEAKNGLKLHVKLIEAKDKEGNSVAAGLCYKGGEVTLAVGVEETYFPLELLPNESKKITLGLSESKLVQSFIIQVTLPGASTQELKWSRSQEKVLSKGNIELKVVPTVSIAKDSNTKKWMFGFEGKVKNNTDSEITANQLKVEAKISCSALSTYSKLLGEINPDLNFTVSAGEEEVFPIILPLPEAAVSNNTINALAEAGFTVELIAKNIDNTLLNSVDNKVEVKKEQPVAGNILLKVAKEAQINRTNKDEISIAVLAYIKNTSNTSFLDLENVDMYLSVKKENGEYILEESKIDHFSYKRLGIKEKKSCTTGINNFWKYTKDNITAVKKMELTAICTLKLRDGTILEKVEQKGIKPVDATTVAE